MSAHTYLSTLRLADVQVAPVDHASKSPRFRGDNSAPVQPVSMPDELAGVRAASAGRRLRR